MKSLFALLAFVFATQAHALTFSQVKCEFEDWQRLNQAVAIGNASKGGEYLARVSQMLGEEMGPSCVQLIPDEITFGIPGDSQYDYLLSSGDEVYAINVYVGGVESGYRTSISIVKK